MGLTVCLKKGRVLILGPKLPYLGGELGGLKTAKPMLPQAHGKERKCALGRENHPKVTESCSPSGSRLGDSTERTEAGWTNPLSFLGVPATLSILKPHQSAHMRCVNPTVFRVSSFQ